MLKYILFQHFTRFLLQYIYNASDVQNEIQQSSDGTLDADEGQGHEQCCGYGCDSQQSRRDARYCYQAARHRKEQDGVGPVSYTHLHRFSMGIFVIIYIF